MTDWRQRADELIEEFNDCCRAKPRHDAVNFQLEKDRVSKFASHLATQRAWGGDLEIAEACHQLESRMKTLKEKLIMEILSDGTV
jgi:hypothetical protein